MKINCGSYTDKLTGSTHRVSGDPAAVESYSDYGAEVLAVTDDATVVATPDSRRPGPRLAARPVDHHAGER